MVNISSSSSAPHLAKLAGNAPIAVVDPFTYAVHAFKSLLLKNTGFGAITGDILYLLAFSAVTMTAATMLFKRTL